MTESEPSAPLPVGASIRFALAAAIERAERAEDDAAHWKHAFQVATRSGAQARAQLAKVREWASVAASIDVGERGDYTATVHGERNYTNALATREHGETLLAILDPVGATEDEAKP